MYKRQTDDLETGLRNIDSTQSTEAKTAAQQHREAVTSDREDLESELTEEVDFPAATQSIGAKTPTPSLTDTVFSLMENIGQETLSEADLSGSQAADSSDILLDNLGDNFDLDLTTDVGEMNFDVTADDLAAAAAARKQEAELSRIAKEQSAADQEHGTDRSLEKLLDAAFSMEHVEEGAADPETSAQESNLPDFFSSLEHPDVLLASGAAPVSTPEASQTARDGTRQTGPNEDSLLGGFEDHLTDSSLSDGPSPNTNASQFPGQDLQAEEPSPLQILMAEVPENSAAAISAQTAIPIARQQTKRKDQDPENLAKSPAGTGAKESAENSQTDSNSDRQDANAPKWEKMTEEELLAYIMFYKEYPRIQCKPLKAHPIKRAAAS